MTILPGMPMRGRPRGLGVVFSPQRTRENVRLSIAAVRAMLREIGAWRPDTAVPAFDAAMRDVAAHESMVDALDAKLSRDKSAQALTDEDSAVLKRWEGAADAAHVIWAERTRPTITADEAARLLKLAKGAKAIVDSAILRAADPAATAEDGAAAVALGRCSDQVVSSVGAVDLLIARLEKAAGSKAGAHVTAREVAALESFAGCAMELPPAKPRPPALTPAPATSPALQAVIGAGIPTAASVLIGLLRKK
jgi:hypothetical protein